MHPEEYGEVATEAHGDFDRGRDAIALGIIRACVERGQPIFGICRGFQEVAVAMGSTLHPEIRDLPGRDNHRMPPDGTMEEKFALRHIVSVTENGPFHKVFGATEVRTNSLHGQGIERVGARVVDDEAVRSVQRRWESLFLNLICPFVMDCGIMLILGLEFMLEGC